MDDRRFDAITRSLASGKNRRQLLKGLLGVGMVVTGGTALRSAGVDAARRPPPTPRPQRCPGQQTWDGSACGCPDGTTQCGPDCCPAGAATCCDNACCYGTCVNEEVCCPTGTIFCDGSCRDWECCNESSVCSGYETCGGGGIQGACGCTPTFTQANCDGITCGDIPNGCGIDVSCGCGDTFTCSDDGECVLTQVLVCTEATVGVACVHSSGVDVESVCQEDLSCCVPSGSYSGGGGFVAATRCCSRGINWDTAICA